MFSLITELKNHKKQIKKVQEGFKCLKHGRYGSPHMKSVVLSEKKDTIHWRDLQKDTRKCAPFSEFTELVKGITTKVLLRIPKKDQPAKEDLCISLIAQKRTLDFEFKSKEERDEWFTALNAAFEDAKFSVPKKFKDNGVNVGDITKCENALSKFSFDIESTTWKILKTLTRSAKFTDDDYTCVGQCLENNHLLRVLDLAENSMSDTQLQALCQYLNRAPQVTQLNLSGNAISNDGIVHLSKALKQNKTLKILDLRGNTITDSGADALANAISSHKVLEELYLDKNAIADEGSSSLAANLHLHESMRILSINDNSISNQGAKDLASTQKSSKQLQIVRMARNQIIFPEEKQCEDDGSLEINLFLAVDSGNYPEMVLLLLQGADPNVQNEEDGRTPLHVAAMHGNLDILDFLLDHPAMDLNVRDDKQMTALTLAMSNRQNDVVKLLLDKGSDLRVGDKDQKTAIHLACEQGDKVIVKLLVEQYNDDILRTTTSDQTSLHFAAANLHKSVVEYLLQRDELEKKERKKNKQEPAEDEMIPYVNFQDTLGETALHKVFTNGKVDVEVAKLLIQKGADIALEDTKGKTALDYCSQQHRELLLNESRRRMATK